MYLHSNDNVHYLFFYRISQKTDSVVEALKPSVTCWLQILPWRTSTCLVNIYPSLEEDKYFEVYKAKNKIYRTFKNVWCIYLKKKPRVILFVFLTGNLFSDHHAGYFLEAFSVSIRNLSVDLNIISAISSISDVPTKYM